MKRCLALLICLSFLFTSCFSKITGETSTTIKQQIEVDIQPTFTDFNDEAFLQYTENSIYQELVSELNSDAYFVENVNAIYVSKEYLEEVNYNSQANIYFGYTLAEIEEVFHKERFIFTLGENGETIVQPFEAYDDTFQQVLKNVTVGTGIILLCVTISAVGVAVNAPVITIIFATSAVASAKDALVSGGFGAISAGIITGLQTGDFHEALKSAALAGSEAFKWGAFTGVVEGGIEGVALIKALKGANLTGLTLLQAAKIQKETKWSVDIIKDFQTMDQYNICKTANVFSEMVEGKQALIRKIDLDFTDSSELTNIQRMRLGKPPLDSTGTSYELHHLGQRKDSTLVILTRQEHRSNENYKIWHLHNDNTENPSRDPMWEITKKNFWKAVADILENG